MRKLNPFCGNTFIFPLLLLLMFSCHKNREFPAQKDLALFPHSEFIITREDSLSRGKNSVYSVSMLYAWDLVKENLTDISIDKKYRQLCRLHAADNFKNALHKSELDLNILMEDYKITATAAYKKSLPFDTKLERFSKALLFNKEAVESFGLYGGNEEMAKCSEILYYQNDSNFVIKLVPKDQEHEILIYMASDDSSVTFNQHLSNLYAAISAGKLEKENHKQDWKFNYSSGDVLQIPALEFNLSTNFSSLIRNELLASGKTWTITKAEQQTAFILDEVGAEIESKATVELEVAAILPAVPEHPKQMIVNKNFLIVLKRKDCADPYFMAWVDNTELMRKIKH